LFGADEEASGSRRGGEAVAVDAASNVQEKEGDVAR
jgi:hypothetical protein